jgi:hypothetical protein
MTLNPRRYLIDSVLDLRRVFGNLTTMSQRHKFRGQALPELRLVASRLALLAAMLNLCLLWSVIPASAQLESLTGLRTNVAPNSVVVGDFNLDGKMDLAVSSYGSSSAEVQVYLGKGNGTFSAATAYDVGPGTGPLATVDLNHDGKPDLVVINNHNESVAVLLGNGDGTFRPPVNYTTAPGPVAIAVGDFNGDGNIDIVTANQADASNTCDCVAVLIGNGDGTFQNPPVVTALPNNLPLAVASGHLSGDGNLDLAVTSTYENSGRVQILLGNGDGSFRIGTSYTITPDSVSIIATSLRKKTVTDLAVAEFDGTGVAVLLGNGDGTFKQPVLYKAGAPEAVISADINGDGIPDLIAADSAAKSGLIYLLLGNGDGTFRAPTQIAIGQFLNSLAVSDFNGDHLPDIAVSDQTGNAEIVLLNTGVASFSPNGPLAFKNQKVGTTSPAQKVTLTNTGKTALNISAMKVAGQFAMTSTCSKAITPNKSCTISVTFSPKSQGAKSGTITINDSASSKPQVIELSGTGS